MVVVRMNQEDIARAVMEYVRKQANILPMTIQFKLVEINTANGVTAGIVAEVKGERISEGGIILPPGSDNGDILDAEVEDDDAQNNNVPQGPYSIDPTRD